MNTNQRYNQAAIKKFRKELSDMLDDIAEIDINVLNKAVNEGVKVAKQNTNVETGFMRKNWRSTPAVKRKGGGVTKTMVNTADYSSFVNYGHRIVNQAGETVGWVDGQFMLEKAIGMVDKELVKQFKKEVERVNREHGK
jgi:hypothetical protein